MYTATSEAGVAIEAVAALARYKSLNVAQKYARKADQLGRAPVEEPGLGNLTNEAVARQHTTREQIALAREAIADARGSNKRARTKASNVARRVSVTYLAPVCAVPCA
jgi:hypothetical protein